jgi:hypothetical protein
MLFRALPRAHNPVGTRDFPREGVGIVSVDAALPELGPAPRRSDLGRRIRFALYTLILVAAICMAGTLLRPPRTGHHGHRVRSSAHVAPRASIGIAPATNNVHAVAE